MAERGQQLEAASPLADSAGAQVTASSPPAPQRLPADADNLSTAASQPPPLEPLFTLLTNTTSNTTVHPRVQYIFSDDDPSALSNPDAQPAGAGPASNAPGDGTAATGPQHRTIVVDLAPAPDNSRWTVAWASSMSPDFAVTGSDMALQQSGAGDGASDGSGAPVLRLEGVEREPVDPRGGDSLPGSSSGSATVGREDVEGLADEFRRRMGVLRKVVGEGERRREAVAKRHDEAQQQHENEHDHEHESQQQQQPQAEDPVEGSRRPSVASQARWASRDDIEGTKDG
ncbi:Protein-lysine N-methyltransferase EFM2 [Purpureocillium lavendulum]|uniref:Protein-lysine N-methyltransferase EFM2 n=1 Tax=Purpureocillium lavendulum TaxID=1247861 RepID=A0AB34FV63_9HYPO|nr:Protein-lysine N-methyltransferase EFM2 [Purpureocillium lavendulum]